MLKLSAFIEMKSFKLRCINTGYKGSTLGSVFEYFLYVQINVYDFTVSYTFPIYQTEPGPPNHKPKVPV